MRGWVAMGAAMGLLGAPVQAACWTRDEAVAAGVRKLQSMLMVTALRCEAGGTRVMGDYNAFIAANRSAIADENDRLLAHFVHALGMVAGQHAYDGFTTTLANAYGAGEGAPETCADAADLTREARAIAGSRDGLLLLVDRLGLDARLPEGRCEAEVTVASAAPAPNPVFADAAGYAGARGPLAVRYGPSDALLQH